METKYEIAPGTALGIKLKSEPVGIQLPKRTAKPTADCLFCKEEDSGDLCSDKDSKAIFYWVQCSKCEACGPTSYDADEAVRLWDRASRLQQLDRPCDECQSVRYHNFECPQNTLRGIGICSRVAV